MHSRRFAKMRSSYEACSLGLGNVPNEPVQILRAGLDLDTARQVLNSHPDMLANLQIAFCTLLAR